MAQGIDYLKYVEPLDGKTIGDILQSLEKKGFSVDSKRALKLGLLGIAIKGQPIEAAFEINNDIYEISYDIDHNRDLTAKRIELQTDYPDRRKHRLAVMSF